MESHLLYQFHLKHKDNVPSCGIWLLGNFIRHCQQLQQSSGLVTRIKLLCSCFCHLSAIQVQAGFHFPLSNSRFSLYSCFVKIPRRFVSRQSAFQHMPPEVEKHAPYSLYQNFNIISFANKSKMQSFLCFCSKHFLCASIAFQKQ